MIKYLPILLMLAFGLLAYFFSAWRTIKELNERSTLLVDPELRRLTDVLAKAVGVERITVYLYEIAPLNGLAAPDGRIFLTRGFYQKFRDGTVTAPELISVVAHELGHVALGHTRRRMIDFTGQNAVRFVLAGMLNRFLPGIGPMIAGWLTTMLMAGLSRKNEYEADAYAAALLTKAGIGIGPQISLFRKLATHAGAPTAPAWLLSHPTTDDRIRTLEGLQAKWGRDIPA